MKRCEISITIRGMQMKASACLSSWLKFNHTWYNQGCPGIWKQLALLYITSENESDTDTMGSGLAVSIKVKHTHHSKQQLHPWTLIPEKWKLTSTQKPVHKCQQ